MAHQYRCAQKRRLEMVRQHPTLNGIDYLEVLDREAPLLSPRQQTLLVHCLKPIANLTAGNVRIDGGVRISSVKVVWAYPCNSEELPGLFKCPADLVPDPALVLVVRTDSSGDFSPYRLSLVRSPSDPSPPQGFDPILSQVTFSFKVECPIEFDCQIQEVCPPRHWPEPKIDYLAKDYPSFRRLMLDRLAVLLPEWTERSPADLGVALVELLAYTADHLSYYQDAVATEAYLGTARKRISVRRHARLLDYHVHEGCNARAWVIFKVDDGADGAVLAPGTRLLTKTEAPRGAVSKEQLTLAVQNGSQVFETRESLTLKKAHERLPFYTWGDEECCLPKGATRATLKGHYEDLQPGDVLIFAEEFSPKTGKAADADPVRRQAVRLTGVVCKTPDGEDLTDPLTNERISEITWHEGDALTFPLCLSTTVQLEKEPEYYLPEVSAAWGNVILADHGLTLTDQPVLPGTVPDSGRYRPRLEHRYVTYGVPVCEADQNRARSQPAAQGLVQDPSLVLPVVTLWRQTGPNPDRWEEEWEVRRDLLGSDPFDKAFVVEKDEEGYAHLRFGDGVLGQAPAAGMKFKAAYRVGKGRAGNVGAEAIAHVVTNIRGITDVLNPLPAQGGSDPESLERVRLSAPQAFRTQERAVTEADYANMAQRFPSVQKAVATRRWTGSWHTIFVTVDRKGGRPVDPDFVKELKIFLGRYRLTGHDLEVRPPTFVPLDIALTVCVAPGYFRDQVKNALLTVFSNVDLPDGRRGFFHPDNFTFGQAVYLSQIIASVMEVPGVVWVDAEDTAPKPNRFQRWGELPRDELAVGRIAMGPLEVARLDNDPNAPENGKIEFFLEGGS